MSSESNAIRRNTARTKVDFSPLLGTWVNSNRGGVGIARFSISETSGHLKIKVVEAADNGLNEWDEVAIASLYTGGPNSDVAAGFNVEVETGVRRSRLQVNIKLGVAVLAAFHTYPRASRKVNQFVREFFALAP